MAFSGDFSRIDPRPKVGAYPATIELPCLRVTDIEGGNCFLLDHATVKVPVPKGMTPTQLAAFREGARRAGREMRRLLTNP